jgi:hypothetical protein
MMWIRNPAYDLKRIHACLYLSANKLHICTNLVSTLSSDSHSSPTWTDEPTEPPILQVCAAAGWPSGWRHLPPPLAPTPSPSFSPSPGLTAPANAKHFQLAIRVRKNFFKRILVIFTFLNEGEHENKREILGNFLKYRTLFSTASSAALQIKNSEQF